MGRTLTKLVFLLVVLAAGTAGVWHYYDQQSSDRKIQQLEQQKQELIQIVDRISSTRRLADVLVTRRQMIGSIQQTTLLLVEYGRDGKTLPPKSFTVEGNNVHVDAMVIQFEQGYVEKDDPLRGKSIALFHKIYGDAQKPDDASLIDPPNEIPAAYRGADPQVSEFEQGLWKDFWTMLHDEPLRKSKGVEIVQGEGLWWPPQEGKLYTISIGALGGLTLKNTEIHPALQEALKNAAK